MITLGLDIGSVAAKGVLLAPNDKWQVVVPTGWSPRDAGQQIIAELTRSASLERLQIDAIVATGYGRISVPDANKSITEITCHAKGLTSLLPEVRTIIDIGGQDSKVIKLNESGRVIDFAMNDKCAAGTGRFLQVMAQVLGMDVSDLADAEDPSETVSINSMCTVFAESEIIGHLAQGMSRGGLIAGLHQSVAKRVAGMAARVGVVGPVAFTGGVAKNTGIRRALEEELKAPLLTPEECQFTGALGAALLARNL
jgi:predicted CoA-substrate-specific enzyme activase